ncbi:Cyanophycin synthetase [Georgfuchsia toluolica]|uniref:Cyanophycin synthetase n=1 Tax=Georgfuchsia toluolica TaxID=424218 RepID=A0A916N8K3_9PROT|nr:cyanophycin synthetase [Georgfuchsia toluolica]CAG4882696.1 Cyanophycin synthetase [Georgfuchsia toluolica]
MKTKDIKFLRVTYLAGPNIWTYRPALEAWVDIGAFEEFPSNTLPGFVDRLTACLPSLAVHRCGIGEPGGFLLRLRQGTWMGHILEHVTLELQNLIGMRTGFGKTRGTSQRSVYKVVVRSRDEKTSRACFDTARELLLAAVEDRPFDLAAQLAPLRDMAESRFLGPSTACIVDGATERRIPTIRLSEGNLVQLGQSAKSHRIWTAETDLTSAIAEGICSDKDLTKSLLAACGIPVPGGRPVDSPEDAWEAAQEIGLPVVVKPADANHGRGVYVDLSTEADVKASYTRALLHSRHIIVEEFIPGNEHRLLVVGEKLVAAARGESAWVKGDGRATITELIESQINSDPRRGLTEDFPLNIVSLEDDTANTFDLARRGFTPDSVPAKGLRVLIQRNGNVAFDVTDEVHPSIAATVSLAARVVGLDIAGIDLVAGDISRPLREQRGAIVEINAGPGLLMHLKPATGKPRPVGRAIVDHLFAAGENGRIPIVGVTGSKGKTTVSRLIGRMLKLSGKQVGLACGDGLFFDRRRAKTGNCANWASAHRVLLTRSVEAAVFENGKRAILSEGLAYDRCSVGIVTNIDPADSELEFFIETAEQITNVFRTQIDLVLDDGAAVLNAADPLVAELASLCDGEVMFFSRDPAAAPLAQHLANGGRAVLLHDRQIVLTTGGESSVLTAMSQIPMTANTAAAYQTENVLTAVAAAWALKIPRELIRAVIETFDPSRDEALDKTTLASTGM